MGRDSGIKKGGEGGSAKNLHSIIWPAGAAKSGCKTLKNE